MNSQEKSLYHQIHPAKLFVDWSTGLIALYFFWQQDFIAAVIIAIVPSVVTSLIIVRFTDLEPYKQSAFGQYVKQYMTQAMQAIRLLGYLVMAIGAWYHLLWLIPAGLLVIVFGWLRGVLFPQKQAE